VEELVQTPPKQSEELVQSPLMQILELGQTPPIKVRGVPINSSNKIAEEFPSTPLLQISEEFPLTPLKPTKFLP
jgi:hypothetical protein